MDVRRGLSVPLTNALIRRDDVLALLPKERINRMLLPKERQGAETEKAGFFPRGRVGMEQPTEGVMDPGKFDG